MPLKLGDVPMQRTLTDLQLHELRALRLPLHSARIRLDESDARKPLFDQVLAEDGVTLDQFKLRGLREVFFSKGERAALCLPRDLTLASAADELHAGRQKLTLHFELPRGSYATLVVKRLTA